MQLRRFEIVDGYSCPIVIDEEKPGIRGFDTLWHKDGTLTTFQVKRVIDTTAVTAGVKSLQVRTSRDNIKTRLKSNDDVMSDLEDFECVDDGTSMVPSQSRVRYCVQKEEYP